MQQVQAEQERNRPAQPRAVADYSVPHTTGMHIGGIKSGMGAENEFDI